jgi:hypothetical protein
MLSQITGALTMKQFTIGMKRSVVISILIVLLTLALAGTVAAADQQAAGPGSFGNRTGTGPHFQNGTANSSAWGFGNMMQQAGAGRGMTGMRGFGTQRSAGAMQGAGILHMACMVIAMLLAGLLVLVWLIVGILLSILLYRKVRQDKTP